MDRAKRVVVLEPLVIYQTEWIQEYKRLDRHSLVSDAFATIVIAGCRPEIEYTFSDF